MPIYEYRCTSCNHTFEVIQKLSDAPVARCEHCSGTLEKLVSRASFQLKGGGWFRSDYGAPASSGSSESEPSKGKGKGKDSGSGDTSSTPPKGGCGSGACGCAS